MFLKIGVLKNFTIFTGKHYETHLVVASEGKIYKACTAKKVLVQESLSLFYFLDVSWLVFYFQGITYGSYQTSMKEIFLKIVNDCKQ